MTPLHYIAMCAASMKRLFDRDLDHIITDWIVILDGDQRSREIVETITSHLNSNTSKLKVLSMEKNSGLSRARNIGVSISKSEFLTWLDADDTLDADESLKFFRDGIEALTLSEQHFMAISDNFDCDMEANILHKRDKRQIVALHTITRGSIKDPLRWIDFVYQSQLIRRRDFVSVGGYRECQIGEDVALIFDLADKFPDRTIRHIPHCGYHYRMNPDGIVNSRTIELRNQNCRDYASYTHESTPPRHMVVRECTRCANYHFTTEDITGLVPYNIYIQEGDTLDDFLHSCKEM